jgi:hypothetical protein
VRSKKHSKMRIASKKKANPRISAKITLKRHKAALAEVERMQSNLLVEQREKVAYFLYEELAEARWQRSHAYSTGVLSDRFERGRPVSGGFRASNDDNVRRLYTDMWVTSIRILFKLILGLAPELDETEKKYPLTIPSVEVLLTRTRTRTRTRT